MRLKLLPDNAPELTRPSEPVDLSNGVPKLLGDLMAEMKRLCDQHGGVAIAAPQVGVNKRVVVCQLKGFERVLINPVIVRSTGKKPLGLEGCLSFPGQVYNIRRHYKIRVWCCDERGLVTGVFALAGAAKRLAKARKAKGKNEIVEYRKVST